MDFLPPATKLGQGNILRSVCQEFCSRGGGGSAPLHAGIHTPTPGPEAGTPPPAPEAGTPLDQTPPPSAVHAGRYGQQAGGTHPTGMQSCFYLSMAHTFIGQPQV